MKNIWFLSMLCILLGGHFAAFAAKADRHHDRDSEGTKIPSVHAQVIAKNIPNPSAVSQVGNFLNPTGCSSATACACGPIPRLFPAYIEPGAVLDPTRVLVCSSSNFGARPAEGNGQEGSILSISTQASHVIKVPSDFASDGTQSSALGGDVQMFTDNSPAFLNGANNPLANTANFVGVANPLGLSNNYAFGRLWPTSSPFGETGIGTSSVIDPTGKPFANGPNTLHIGGVFAGFFTDRDQVTTPSQPQVIPGSLLTGTVGIALLGGTFDKPPFNFPTPCHAVFAVVTADGAIVQENTLFGVDGLAQPGTIDPLLGKRWEDNKDLSPRLGLLVNPYNLPMGVDRQLFISEPFANTIAVVDITITNNNTGNGQWFILSTGFNIRRISSSAFNSPVDMAPTHYNSDDTAWASNTTLDEDSDIYIANRGNNTIVRMNTNGDIIAIRKVDIKGEKDFKLNGISTSPDSLTIFVTFVDKSGNGGVANLDAF